MKNSDRLFCRTSSSKKILRRCNSHRIKMMTTPCTARRDEQEGAEYLPELTVSWHKLKFIDDTLVGVYRLDEMMPFCMNMKSKGMDMDMMKGMIG
ncbi:MAG TPA: hypothetical protein ENN86_00345 [Desulfobacteraceae bacterium]|nr:hypothetical protein [Desulfobacteraceae bacterium]